MRVEKDIITTSEGERFCITGLGKAGNTPMFLVYDEGDARKRKSWLPVSLELVHEWHRQGRHQRKAA